MAQGIDGIEAGGAAGGHEAEEDADGSGEDEGDDVDLRIKQKWRADDFGEGHAEGVGEGDADDAADAGEGDGLDEELQQDLPRTGTDGKADADLAGALGDGDEHDIHDAYAADEQAHAGHGTEQGGHHLGAGADDIGELEGIEDVEVIFLVGGDFPALAHDGTYVCDDLSTGVAGLAGDHDLVNILAVLAAGEAAQDGGVGGDDVIVQIIAEAALAFHGGDADDFHGHVFDADFLPHGIDAYAEEFFADGLADDADGGGVLHFCLGENAAVSNFPIPDGEVIGGGALDIGLTIIFLKNSGLISSDEGCEGGDAGDLIADGIHICDGKLRCSPAAPSLAGAEDEEIAAHLGNLALHRLGGPTPKGDHGDNGRHADDHADNGEK